METNPRKCRAFAVACSMQITAIVAGGCLGQRMLSEWAREGGGSIGLGASAVRTGMLNGALRGVAVGRAAQRDVRSWL
jgi:hypothetical protein